MSTLKSRKNHLDTRLKRCLLPCTSALIVTHDYPDPDGIASALGIQTLLKFWGVRRVTIAFNGYIGRAENRAMVSLVHIRLTPLDDINPMDFDRVIMVDCSPGAGNVSFPSHVPVHAVIDHHPVRTATAGPCRVEVDPAATSTSIMIARHLKNAGCPISPPLATALYYGIKTDAKDMPKRLSASDVALRKYLLETMDCRLLWSIENPLREADYFRCFNAGLESITQYGSVGLSFLGDITSPDNVAEMADFFSHLNTLECVVCAGIFKGNLFFSVRSRGSLETGRQAERLAHRLNGCGGGHAHSAAGRIPTCGKTPTSMFTKFKKGFLHCFNLSGIKPQKVIVQ